jgi:hypothetical protein
MSHPHACSCCNKAINCAYAEFLDAELYFDHDRQVITTREAPTGMIQVCIRCLHRMIISEPTTKETITMGNIANNLDPSNYDHDDRDQGPPTTGCHRCNGAGRVIVGHYPDGTPVDDLCPCYQGKENPAP